MDGVALRSEHPPPSRRPAPRGSTNVDRAARQISSMGWPVGGNRHGRGRHPVGARRLEGQQHLLRVDHAPAAVGGELEDARVHADGVLGAGLHAEAAEHALAEVDVEALGHLLDLGIRVLAGHDVDAVRGAHRLAHHAGDAARRAVLPPHEAVQGPQPRRVGPPLVRVLDGDGAVGALARGTPCAACAATCSRRSAGPSARARRASRRR